jgi:hypothetical protein
MNLIEKHINDYDRFSKIIQEYKYIHLDIPKQFCCSWYNDKRVFEIEPKLILLRDDEGLSSLPCIKELNSNMNEYYYTKINNINHDY